MARWLIVDDEQSICWGLSQLATSVGDSVDTASSAEEALKLPSDQVPDVIVLDVRLPGIDGLTAIPQLRQQWGDVPIIVMTAHGDLQTAVRAVRQGAFEYVVKPFELEHMQRVVARAIESGDELTLPAGTPAAASAAGQILGKSPAMQEVFNRIALAAPSNACVLLSGESGTGKELAARAIHDHGPRADGPFVAVHVAALSPALAESELFGHVRGAFTGAEQARRGLLVQADGGTLFLDEVADIPLPTQVKMLRALEHGEVTPVGSDVPQRTDFRVVSASHQPLLQRVEEGAFRHDLYFRLSAFQIEIPPLRQRGDDIAELAQHFADSLSSRTDARRPTISASALEELARRPWYGNVRELRNAIEHAGIVARGGRILSEHLPSPIAPALVMQNGSEAPIERQVDGLIRRWTEQTLNDSTVDEVYDALLQLVEPPMLEVALQRHHGQCSAAARRLGLHRTTLRKKLDQHGLDEGG